VSIAAGGRRRRRQGLAFERRLFSRGRAPDNLDRDQCTVAANGISIADRLALGLRDNQVNQPPPDQLLSGRSEHRSRLLTQVTDEPIAVQDDPDFARVLRSATIEQRPKIQ
jgi:hypothetical protein